MLQFVWLFHMPEKRKCFILYNTLTYVLVNLQICLIHTHYINYITCACKLWMHKHIKLMDLYKTNMSKIFFSIISRFQVDGVVWAILHFKTIHCGSELEIQSGAGNTVPILQMGQVGNRGGPVSSRNLAAEISMKKILLSLCTLLCLEDWPVLFK